jgi:hypothetical protein
MTLSCKTKIGVSVGVIALAYLAGWESHRPETITKTQTVTVEKQVDHIVYQDRVVHDQSVTTTVVKKPDGEVDTTTIQANVNTESKKASETDEKVSSTQTTTSTVSTPQQPNYGLGISSKVTLNDPLKPVYQFEADRRLLGPIWVSGTVGMDKSAAIGLRLEF